MYLDLKLNIIFQFEVLKIADKFVCKTLPKCYCNYFLFAFHTLSYTKHLRRQTEIGHLFYLNAKNHLQKNQSNTKDTNFRIMFPKI